MDRDLRAAANVLKGSESILIVSHIDADGISAGAIASITADRLNLKRETVFLKKMTEESVAMINGSSQDAVWICDLGSGSLSGFDRESVIVTDHHVPDPSWRRKQTTLDSFGGVRHLNPHSYGMDGSFETCGAGMTYLLSKTVDPKNIDLAYLAVVGAVGDFQDTSESRLVSLNRSIVKDAQSNGDLVVEEDIRLFGRETRPLIQMLQFSSDPQIPGISDNQSGCYDLLDRLNIPLKDGDAQRVWNDLSEDEKDRLTDALLDAVDPSDRQRLYGEVYTFPKQPKGNGLRDAKEFATILNSCGRYDDAETGMRICYGETDALGDAERNRAEHRRHISSALSYIKGNHLIRERRFIQYFDAGDKIKETVVGIVAGMMLNSPECRPGMPILGFVRAEDGIKVSARADRKLVDKGLDLAEIMKLAAGLVGGFGGGHSIAAGATIPEGSIDEFLSIVEDLVASQVE
jgi:RecJ-like exonuclease